MIDLISIDKAAKLLKVHPAILRRHETADGRWVPNLLRPLARAPETP